MAQLANLTHPAVHAQLASQLNAPIWQASSAKSRVGFQEVWFMKLNQPETQRALWLRFSLLTSSNGFQKVAEVWAVYFWRNQNKELTKVAIKQTHPIQNFSGDSRSGFSIKIADCSLGSDLTQGGLQSKGNQIRWDLQFAPMPGSDSFSAVPEILSRGRILSTRTVTVHERLLFNGSIEINGDKIMFINAPGMQAHFSGNQLPSSWTWAHCNSFINEKGEPSDLAFEGLIAKPKLFGKFPGPTLSAYYLHYQGQTYRFNDLWKVLTLKSRRTLSQLEFNLEKGDLAFKGVVKAEHKDFAGITYEDTNGSLLYCYNSKLADMKIAVYRRGKLEASLDSRGSAAFEFVSRQKNPYVPLLI